VEFNGDAARELHCASGAAGRGVVTIVPVDKSPRTRPITGQRREIGAGRSQVAKSSGETDLNLKIGAPEFRAELR
jgi:hypothetical protein